MMPATVEAADIVCLCNIKLCSMSLVKTVWPSCNDSVLAQMLIYAEKRAEQIRDNKAYEKVNMRVDYMTDVNYEMLSQCWLFKYVQQQLSAGTIDPLYANKVKRAIFNINMRS